MNSTPPKDVAPENAKSVSGLPWGRIGTALFLLVAVLAGAWIRVDTALSSQAFTESNPKGVLRSDPGMLYYITRTIAEADGLFPEDFNADPHFEYPAASDTSAMFSVGQEFYVAWTWKLFGGDMPLQEFALYAMALFASLTVIGIYGLARELTGRSMWGVAAAALFLIIAGNYRTIGFVLIREDFALPWLALHFWALARAFRLRTPSSMVLVGLSLLCAVATWQAMGFFLTIELAAIFAWFLRTGQNPFMVPKAWLTLVVVFLGSLAIPILRSKGFPVSLPALIAASLAIAAFVATRTGEHGNRPRIIALGALLLLIPLAAFLGPLIFAGAGDYSHVIELLSAKLSHTGQLPADPAELGFDARLLWQGPFATPSFAYLWAALRVGLVATAIAFVWGSIGWLRKQDDAPLMVLLAVSVGALLSALLVQRTIVLAAMLSPVVVTVALSKLKSKELRGVLLAVVFISQGIVFQRWIGNHLNTWYSDPSRPGDTEMMMNELGEAIAWIDNNIPAEEAICSDFVSGTAVLAHAGNPMLVQPKYETEASRRRIETFMNAFVHDTPLDFLRLLQDNDCRYVMTNRHFWIGNLYLAGIKVDERWRPDPRTAFARLCDPDPRTLAKLRNFQLIYRSNNPQSKDFIRIYRVR